MGLMGAVARAARDGGGAVLGVIPRELMPREVSGEMIGETRIARDMHDRKATMAAEADAFIALPGGYGTLEELMEIVTWQQLGYHGKPVGILNTADFYRHFLTFLDHCEGQVRAVRAACAQAAAFRCACVRRAAHNPRRPETLHVGAPSHNPSGQNVGAWTGAPRVHVEGSEGVVRACRGFCARAAARS